MFAPHCPRCRTRVLLGPRRIVGPAAPGGTGFLLKCHCGTIVASDAEPPVATATRERRRAPVRRAS